MWDSAPFKMHIFLSLLLFLNYFRTILTHELISKSKLNSPADVSGQSTREFMKPGETWIVAEGISCWEQNGHWENVQICPPSKIVTAHKFRYLSRTGPTGIELKCTEKNEPDQSQSEQILRINFEGQVDKNLPRGGWENWKNGSRSVFAEGFSFSRGELSLRRSVKNYNLIYHSGNQKDSDFVVWKCPEDHAICGVTAMMDKAGLGILTALGLKCCFHCVPEEKWVQVHHFNNLNSTVYKEEVNPTLGVSLLRSPQAVKSSSVNSKNPVDPDLLADIFTHLGESKLTRFDWTSTAASVWTEGTPVTKTHVCKGQSSCTFKQLVGVCGSSRVSLDKFCLVSRPLENLVVDSCNEILGPGFHPFSNCSVAMEMEIPPSPRSKKHTIYPYGNTKKVDVLCDFESDGGQWTVIQKRTRGPKFEFQRNWTEYQNGFGSLDGNFWLGLENIHALTKNGDQELRIELEDFEGEKRWVKYSNFSVSDASDFYRLTIGGFDEDSTAGDSMTNEDPKWGSGNILNGQRFSTRDKDNDKYLGGNCAADHRGGGGGWFNACSFSSLNGVYHEKGEPVPDYRGIIWYSWKEDKESLAKTEMKIRKRKS